MTAFHLFPRLPFELRARIWELTVEPRTVDVRIKHREYKPPLLVSSTPVPGPLQACQEARNLQLYQQAFSEIPRSGTERRYIWVNMDIDLISIGKTSFKSYKTVAPMIHRLKFEGENSNDLYYHFSMKELRAFVNVKEIHVVCADGMSAWYGALEDHHWPCGEENVFMIDPTDGRMMRGMDMDEMFHQEFKENWAREGYDYDTGEPLT
ncbi:hypothetical protein BDV96DRAFT_352009 [Lophiotrema nucula]|uniref:2EXR domain-containing protein n=1 Tax=Lophiotrema nucula TaxID=690887 RepID=A0A6A5ZMQ5_9PLEO|nr:hypothetical protein BDV96DRAFT_352009 [Lophiotrema nucula]